MDVSPSHQRGPPTAVQIPRHHRRRADHGAPAVYNPHQQQSTASAPHSSHPHHPPQPQLQQTTTTATTTTQGAPGHGDVYDPERLRQMFSQLQAYNAIDGAGQVASPYGLGPGASPATTARPSMPTNLWTAGAVAHLQSPVFAQEQQQQQVQQNPYTGPAVFSEFAAGFAPAALGDFGNNAGSASGGGDAARAMGYAGQGRPQQAMHHSLGGSRHGSTAGQTADSETASAQQPAHLDAWREKLFHVREMLVLTQQQYQTYWPHVDNVYSHRSTQRYKNRPFLAHYYDCRLKGRPAGTPKSTDPNKKKRKRVARERDLCDVKIKITEYMPGATRDDILGHLVMQPGKEGSEMVGRMLRHHGSGGGNSGGRTWTGGPGIDLGADGALVSAFYTIQRVNNAAAAGDEDVVGDVVDGSVGGGHRHTLEESDRVKKNSVIRANLKGEKQRRKSSVQILNGDKDKKTYHKKATGAALDTANKHSGEHELKLYGSCFCPFVQRVWIALELKRLQYQYVEVDPYAKPKSLLDVNPRGLVPALRHGDWGCYESTVLMEYLEDLGQGAALLPRDPRARADSRLWADHINRHVVPAFYRYLQEQDADAQARHAQELRDALAKLVDAADPRGPFFLGAHMGFVDVQLAPWVVRMSRVLGPYRGWPDPEVGSRWAAWVLAIEADPSVVGTTSDDQLYLDSYERYAENRPNTSQVADAVNSGRGLP